MKSGITYRMRSYETAVGSDPEVPLTVRQKSLEAFSGEGGRGVGKGVAVLAAQQLEVVVAARVHLHGHTANLGLGAAEISEV
jgi:hypothetical protein